MLNFLLLFPGTWSTYITFLFQFRSRRRRLCVRRPRMERRRRPRSVIQRQEHRHLYDWWLCRWVSFVSTTCSLTYHHRSRISLKIFLSFFKERSHSHRSVSQQTVKNIYLYYELFDKCLTLIATEMIICDFLHVRSWSNLPRTIKNILNWSVMSSSVLILSISTFLRIIFIIRR